MEAEKYLSPLEMDTYELSSNDTTDRDSIATIDISNQIFVDSATKFSSTENFLLELSQDGTTTEDRVTLAYERLTELPKSIVDRFADHVTTLDISHNNICNLDGLVFFKRLTSLIADDNPITEACNFPPMPKLQLLWLNHCRIRNLFPWLKKLRDSCPNLKYLCLMGNPAAPSYLNGGTFYEYLQYRLFVISEFPDLVHLDDRAVTEDQRKEAHRMYKKPLFESIFHKDSVLMIAVDKQNAKFSAIKERFMKERERKIRANVRNLVI